MILIASGISFYVYNGPTSKTNSKIITDYPALKDDSYINSLLLGEDKKLSDLAELTNGELSFFLEAGNNEGFHCNDGNTVKRVEYSSYSMGRNVDGGWGGTDVLDCGSYYYVFESGDAGPGPVYGPFRK